MENYKNQVRLLLFVLIEVAKENCFALHGGTAINLFHRNMPRLSVDIDLTYLPIETRLLSLKNINLALIRIKKNIENSTKDFNVAHRKKDAKLLISTPKARVKLEVNLTKRGCYADPVTMILCDRAQEEYEIFCEMKVVEIGQLYGGKVCAALDRQHPRDLFDINKLLNDNGFTASIKKGFIFYLISGNRPIHELLEPHYLDHQATFETQFAGMTIEDFNYKDYEETRVSLVKAIQDNLNEGDIEFLESFIKLSPDWDIYDFEKYPAVQWKLLNLKKLRKAQPEKYKALVKESQRVLRSI